MRLAIPHDAHIRRQPWQELVDETVESIVKLLRQTPTTPPRRGPGRPTTTARAYLRLVLFLCMQESMQNGLRRMDACRAVARRVLKSPLVSTLTSDERALLHLPDGATGSDIETFAKVIHKGDK
jgi:hypothetical protein